MGISKISRYANRKILISNFNIMEDKDTLTYNNQSIFTILKNFFSNLAEFSLNLQILSTSMI